MGFEPFDRDIDLTDADSGERFDIGAQATPVATATAKVLR